LISVFKEPERVHFQIGRSCILPMLTCQIQTGIEWFMGHGVNRWSLTRGASDKFTIKMEAMVTPKPLAYGNISLIKELVVAKYFPTKLAKEDVWHRNQTSSTSSIVHRQVDGMSKVAAFDAKQTAESIVDSRQIDINITMSYYAYGTADMIVGLFVKGATVIKHQCALDIAQTWANIGVSKDFFKTRINYDPNLTVGELP